jgi:DNA-binding beta-propeller fold protein YncE
VCTFGSRNGIHPPRLLNKKPALAALGEPENPYGLVFPVAVTTDLRGRVWITDNGTASVHVFDRESGGYREFRKLDGIPLVSPSAITSDDQGRIYLADAGTGALYVFDEHGEYDHSLTRRGPRILETPSAIALSEDNRTIYVADAARNVILELNREGEVDGRIELPAELSRPAALAVVHNQIYVLGAQRHIVGVFSPGGKRREDMRWEGVVAPTAFAYDTLRGRFDVANQRWMVVDVFDEAGHNLGSFGQLGERVDQMLGIDCIHADRRGSVYIVDSHHGKVLVFGEIAGK